MRLPRLLTAAAVAAPLLCAAAALLVEGWPAQRYLLFYLAPIAAAFPLWLRLRLGERPPRGALVVDAVVVALAAVRVVTPVVPVSGHMLFFVHAGLTSSRAWYRWWALALAVETTYFKLVLWHDVRSWAAGLALGLVAAGVWRVAGRASASDAAS